VDPSFLTRPSHHASQQYVIPMYSSNARARPIQSSPSRTGKPSDSTPRTQYFISASVTPSSTLAQKVRCSALDARLHQASANSLS
jgi:hypothetical protein